MMSMTSCNLLLASFGISCEVPSVGRAVKRNRPIGLAARACSSHGLDSHQKSLHLTLSRFSGSWVCLLYLWTQANVDPHPPQQTCQTSCNRWRRLGVRYSSFTVPLTLEVCTLVLLDALPAGSARCRLDSKREFVCTSCLI